MSVVQYNRKILGAWVQRGLEINMLVLLLPTWSL